MKNKYECSGGGKGGKGGIGGPNVPCGHDGEDDEPRPGGKIGDGGRPAVSKNDYTWNGNRNNDPWFTRWFGIGGPKTTNEEEHNSSGDGRGGKGGVGYNNVPSRHDSEDCEPGPGGKGGAGGTPAVSKNAYTRNGNWNNDPWYTRWLGIRGPKKTNEQEHNSSGGGKGGVGYNNVPSGHKGEDGEAGPGGKGGRGGRPAM
ncbi:PE-PGRS family protein PE_PGRS5-like [Ruditapes philippinarum]|uniref:PE-PGRS family protein PE_PGRS5-like n=1 Tax=Ruditapes philippinarum TaxID=129788 RepID=UPI00295BA685|nr:PE-PGRS family protein PE_PGRS5-like [Ruditapes philippinarum]XP_060577266.1 PE-PGRS family protein PE_PGRS5-like [Ruditapes philippinarum]XP_060577267.1 PE-PGRS family protein PE_PGRS5-like [Ruditapes philippinarum]XP_060577268.1 PE-PGRS family protein PE_PGRS5-like [Ruditapes philippinarum]